MQPSTKFARVLFPLALRRAIHRAWSENKITGEQAYLLLDVVNGVKRGGRFWRRQELMRDAETACRKELLLIDPHAAQIGDIDWGNLIDKLVEWMPIIIRVLLVLLAYAEPPKAEPSQSKIIKVPQGPNRPAKD